MAEKKIDRTITSIHLQSEFFNLQSEDRTHWLSLFLMPSMKPRLCNHRVFNRSVVQTIRTINTRVHWHANGLSLPPYGKGIIMITQGHVVERTSLDSTCLGGPESHQTT